MATEREYVAWDNSDRKDFIDDWGNVVTTHVDRTKLDGTYSHTVVYNENGKEIGSFVKD